MSATKWFRGTSAMSQFHARRRECLWCWLWTVHSPSLSPSISKNFLVHYPGIFLARFEFATAMLARHQQEHPAAPWVRRALCSILTGPLGYRFWEGPLLSVTSVWGLVFIHEVQQELPCSCRTSLGNFCQGSFSALEAATIQLAVGLMKNSVKPCYHNLKTYRTAEQLFLLM